MYWATQEAIRTGSRRLHLGSSLSEFMRELGLNPRNGRGPRSDAVQLKDQMEKLFRATMSFEFTDGRVRRWTDMQVAPAGELWWDPKKPDEPFLWESWVELGDKFYEAIRDSPIPLDMRALRSLKDSALALDLYAWSTYKTFRACKTGKPQALSWTQLEKQLGANYIDTKSFRRSAKRALNRVRLVYPGLRLQEIPGRIVVHPGRTAVPPR